VLGALRQGEDRTTRRLEHLSGAREDLAGHQERDQPVDQPLELPHPGDQVVLVAAVGVPGGIGVVLEQGDPAGDPLLGEALLRGEHEVLDDPLAGLVVQDRRERGVAFRRGVLGMGTDVEVQPGAVLEEHVR
jgi:hypothetical protein